jgi:hypothetical protein
MGARILIAAAAAVVMSSIAPAILAAGKTANSLLAKSAAAAKKWDPGAQLVAVETSNADPKGFAPNWTFVFESAVTKKQIGVMAEADGSISHFDTSTNHRKPIAGFVDSDKVMAVAVKNGLKVNTWGMKMRLSVRDQPEWTVQESEHFYRVDAASGKFLKKEAL